MAKFDKIAVLNKIGSTGMVPVFYHKDAEVAKKVVKACLNAKTDISYYDRNREALYNGLKELGFECVRPEGAFYLFVKSPVEDEKAFCAAAKKYNILIVPGSSFGCPGYVRIAYCVAYETIVNSLPKFKELAGEYK